MPHERHENGIPTYLKGQGPRTEMGAWAPCRPSAASSRQSVRRKLRCILQRWVPKKRKNTEGVKSRGAVGVETANSGKRARMSRPPNDAPALFLIMQGHLSRLGYNAAAIHGDMEPFFWAPGLGEKCRFRQDPTLRVLGWQLGGDAFLSQQIREVQGRVECSGACSEVV